MTGIEENIVEKLSINDKPTEEKSSNDDGKPFNVHTFLETEFPEKMKEVDRLCNIEDPETHPYDSKYAAVKILKEMESEITSHMDGKDKSLEVTLALIRVRMGNIHLDTEETFHGEQALMAALDVMESDWPAHPAESLQCFNGLGILWNDRGDFQKAETYLLRAENLYHSAPYDKNGTIDEKLKDEVEDNHTKTLFYLAQVYGHSKSVTKSANYCLKTLQRQLKSGKFVPPTWSSHALSLSDYYCAENQLKHAGQCLIAASIIICVPSAEAIEENSYANLCIGWGKLFLQYLTISQQHTKSLHAGIKTELPFLKEENAILFKELNTKTPVKLPSSIPSFLASFISKGEIPFKEISNYEDARTPFLHALECFDYAKKYYILDNFVTDHWNILQDICSLYRALVYYETDPARKAKMYRRQIDLIEHLSSLLNPQYYMNTLQLINFNLGELYHELFDVKVIEYGYGEGKQQPPAHVKKMNEIITKAGKYFQLFIKSFEKPGKKDAATPPPSKIEIEIDPENIEAYVVARFSMAKLFSRIQAPTQVLIPFLNESLEQYKWISEFKKENPTQIPKEQGEIAQQMVEMLPIKISVLQNR
eukprot:TRINITY_DN6524_c0_g1_i1.p1 TRINITY_DN6524_c0_g1~~TRINITY_DN6524_c0_g1_i1.p1  ORF type:complete len:640 (-),score=143.03 TRINITY_DN6524_c0_g1_i1:95-1873(-)